MNRFAIDDHIVQHRDQPPCAQILAHMKLAQPRQSHAEHSQVPYGFAVVGDDRSVYFAVHQSSAAA